MDDAVTLQLLPPPPEEIMPIGGFVFICNHFTVQESFRRMIFGLPQQFREAVLRIMPGLPLFLFNTDTNSLHGIYRATSYGGMNLDPLFCPNLNSPGSLYPAQVRFGLMRHFRPLPSDDFQRVVTYYGPLAYCFLMTIPQTQLLMEVFRIHWRCDMVIDRHDAWYDAKHGVEGTADYSTTLDTT